MFRKTSKNVPKISEKEKNCKLVVPNTAKNARQPKQQVKKQFEIGDVSTLPCSAGDREIDNVPFGREGDQQVSLVN
jgi:hypothetical protein